MIHNIFGTLLPAVTFGLLTAKANSEFEKFLDSPGMRKHVPIELQQHFVYYYATKYVKVISLICYTHYFRDEVQKVGKFLGVATKIFLENGYSFSKVALEVLSPIALSTAIFLKDFLTFLASNIFTKALYDFVIDSAHYVNSLLHSGPSVPIKPFVEMIATGIGFVLKFIKDEPWQEDFKHLCDLVVKMKEDIGTMIDDFVNGVVEWWNTPSNFVDNIKYSGDIAVEKLTYIFSFEVVSIGFIAAVQIYVDYAAKKITHKEPAFEFAESDMVTTPQTSKAKVIEFMTKTALNALSIPVGQGLRDWAEEVNIQQAYMNKYKYPAANEDTFLPETVDASRIETLEVAQSIESIHNTTSTTIVTSICMENQSNAKDIVDLGINSEAHLVDEKYVESNC